MATVKITIPRKAAFALERETLDEADTPAGQALHVAIDNDDLSRATGPVLHAGRPEVRLLARAIGRALMRFEPSTAMRRAQAPQRAALRQLRDRLRRHASLYPRTVDEGYVVVGWHGDLATGAVQQAASSSQRDAL